jgi:hypothetical protein
MQQLLKWQTKYTRSFKLAAILAASLVFVGGLVFLAHQQVQTFFLHAAGYSSELVQLSPAFYSATESQVMGAAIINTEVKFLDKRAYVLDQYFRAANSPLFGTGKIFVAACDRYGAPRDCTTVAAIARAETDLCKYFNSAEYYNCWGFGGGGADRIKFNNWQESIDLVTDRLVNTYGLKYMIDPSLMEKVFCGSEPGCTNWGIRVKFYMNEISEHARTLGFTQTLFDLR